MQTRPAGDEYAPFYGGYVDLVTEPTILEALEAQREEVRRHIDAVSTEKEQYRYGEGKWSIREVLGHVIDAERVFSYRAFCISRGEKVSLPGFDENAYVAASRHNERSLVEHATEFDALRGSNLALFRSLDEEGWKQKGTASDAVVSVRAIAYIMVGHARHHMGILRDRYGVSP